jgi:syntaxin-binding protein 1
MIKSSSSLLNLMPSQTDKLRLALLYLISQNGISEEDRQKIITHNGLLLTDSEIQALTNLSMFGVRQSISYDTSRDTENPYAHKNRSGVSRDDKFDHCRFVPAVKSIIEEEIDGRLSTEMFPYVVNPVVAPPRTPDSGGPPQLRNTKPSWATRKAAPKVEVKKLSASGPKVIVFIIGGMTYSEMRTAYEVMAEKGREVIIGM